MAKRRAEDTLLHLSPSKRCYRSLSSVDMQLESMAPSTGGVSLSPPSLLALLGSRCRKRPHYFEDPEKQEEEEGAAALHRRLTHCDTSRKHAANVNVLTVQTSGSFQDRRSSSTTSKKRPREDCTSSKTVPNDKVSYWLYSRCFTVYSGAIQRKCVGVIAVTVHQMSPFTH